MVQWKEAFTERAGLRDWGGEKKEIELQQMKLIYFQSKRGKWLRLVERGGMPWNIKPSPEQASRLFEWQLCCACSLGAVFENKHAHFCYFSVAVWERLTAPMPQYQTSATSFRLAVYIFWRTKSLCPAMCAELSHVSLTMLEVSKIYLSQARCLEEDCLKENFRWFTIFSVQQV